MVKLVILDAIAPIMTSLQCLGRRGCNFDRVIIMMIDIYSTRVIPHDYSH